jgi:hypothetical protein
MLDVAMCSELGSWWSGSDNDLCSVSFLPETHKWAQKAEIGGAPRGFTQVPEAAGRCPTTPVIFASHRGKEQFSEFSAEGDTVTKQMTLFP